jgi:hypothetical protein
MSEMSNLSHEYATAAEFARQINDALLHLKKEYLKIESIPTLDEERVERSREFLAGVVKSLIDRLAQEKKTSSSLSVPIPEDVISRFEDRYKGRLNYLLDDLSRIFQALSGSDDLKEQDLDVLDTICDAADVSASDSFRRLWRR